MNRMITWAALGLALLLGSCATTDYVTGRQVNNLWSVQDDIRMGNDIYKDVKKSAVESGIPVNRDAARVEQIDRIVRRIAAVSHLPSLPYETVLLHTNIVNAMAMPGGKMIVFEGLYDGQNGLVRDEDELAAVMAHEIAHVNCRHSTEQLTRNMPWELLLLGGAIYAESRDDQTLQTIMSGAFIAYQGLIVTKYSRDDEEEADRIGLMYMARAGYDPRAAVRLWKRAAQAGGGDPGLLSVFSTHPPSAQRARSLEALLPEALREYEAAKSKRQPVAMRDAPASPSTRIEDPKRSLVSAPDNGKGVQPASPSLRSTGQVTTWQSLSVDRFGLLIDLPTGWPAEWGTDKNGDPLLTVNSPDKGVAILIGTFGKVGTTDPRNLLKAYVEGIGMRLYEGPEAVTLKGMKASLGSAKGNLDGEAVRVMVLTASRDGVGYATQALCREKDFPAKQAVMERIVRSVRTTK